MEYIIQNMSQVLAYSSEIVSVDEVKKIGIIFIFLLTQFMVVLAIYGCFWSDVSINWKFIVVASNSEFIFVNPIHGCEFVILLFS